MKSRYFRDSDTLYIELTLEHAGERADLPVLDVQQVAA